MINKRGSHVGMIASFSLFILFLVVLYIAIEPSVRSKKDNQLFLDYLSLKLNEEFSANLTTIIISNTSVGFVPCVIFNKSEVEINSQNFYVKDKNSNSLGFVNNPVNLTINWQSNQEFIKIFASPEQFNYGGAGGCSGISGTTTNYTIRAIVKDKKFFETKIVNGISNFESLKNNLSIPVANEFALDFQYNNGTVLSSGVVNTQRSVYVNEIIINYIDKNATLVPGKLIVKIW